MLIGFRTYIDEIVGRLERRLDRYEETQQELLTGFPERFALRDDVERIREDAVQIRTIIVGRDRFESLERQVASSSGRRNALLGAMGFLAAIVIALLSWGNSQLSNTQSEVHQNQQSITILDKRIAALEIQVHGLQEKLQVLCRAEAKERGHFVIC